MGWETVLPSLVVGISGLIGSVIGAGSALLAGYFADSRRFKREDMHRDYDQRRDAYLRFISACDRVHEGERGKEVFIEVKRSVQNIKLITPNKTIVETSEKLFLLLAFDTVDDGQPAMKDLSEYDKLLEDFYNYARKDLGKRPFDK